MSIVSRHTMLLCQKKTSEKLK